MRLVAAISCLVGLVGLVVASLIVVIERGSAGGWVFCLIMASGAAVAAGYAVVVGAQGDAE